MRPSEESVRPEPGAALNQGPPTEPRQAASVILLRDPVGAVDPVNQAGAAGGAERLELLLVRRTPQARFMGGVWVFPGGAVDAHEGDGDEAHRAAALRELREEAAIAIDDPAALVKFSRWITPEEVQIRFDTHFFLAELPPGRSRRSTVRSAWISAGSPRARLSTRTARGSSSWCSRRSSTSNSSATSPPWRR